MCKKRVSLRCNMEEEKDIKNENVYIEKVSFSDGGQALQKEEIIRYDIPLDVKKQLLEAIKKADDIIKPTSGGFSRKVKNVKVSAGEGKKHLKENPIKVEIDERTGEVLKKKSRKVIPVRGDDEELTK